MWFEDMIYKVIKYIGTIFPYWATKYFEVTAKTFAIPIALVTKRWVDAVI